MREIKFRFYDGKQMIYNDDINFNYSIKSHNKGEAPGLQQFTGLKDKSGKEIYEGDFINSINLHFVFQVIYDFKNARFIAVSPSNPDNVCIADTWKNREVIGNIYSNPELLKESK